jgi:hypothetical protein
VQRVVHRQQHHRRREPDARGGAGKLRQQDVGAAVDAEQIEMVLADPGGVEPDRLGIECLVVDFPDELLGRARIVGMTIVREGEVAELHGVLRTADVSEGCHALSILATASI